MKWYQLLISLFGFIIIPVILVVNAIENDWGIVVAIPIAISYVGAIVYTGYIEWWYEKE